MIEKRKTPGDIKWFDEARFGMFIHWGLYSMPARHEWIKLFEEIPEEKYDKYFEYFNPDMYDPKEWAAYAKKCGMKYVVITSKHHEGFCLFDSKYTDYKATNTKAGRDLLKECIDAFRAEGIHIGLYYSLLDWHHPEYPIDIIHPRRRDENAQELNKSRDMKKYAEYMRNQVTELLTNYGKIDMLWLDFSYDAKNWPIPNYYGEKWHSGKCEVDWESDKLIATARAIQPDIIINNRSGIEQDLWTPEQYQPTECIRAEDTGEFVTWEACQTFSDSWGYHRDEEMWKSPEMLVEMLIDTVAADGNMILNVGPTSRGYFDSRAVKLLGDIGEWMKCHGDSIYGCGSADKEFKAPEGCKLTQSNDGKRLYIHLFKYPFKYLHLNGFKDKIDYVQFLHDRSELLASDGTVDRMGDRNKISDETVVITLPVKKPEVLVPVIEVFLK